MRRSGRSRPSVAAHRPAEPGIAARLRRPHAFDQPAEHDAVDRSAAALRAGRRCARARPAGRAGAPAFRRRWRGTGRDSRTPAARRRRARCRRSRRTPRSSAVPSWPAKAMPSPRRSLRQRVDDLRDARSAKAVSGCLRPRERFERLERVGERLDQVGGALQLAAASAARADRRDAACRDCRGTS